MSNIEDKHIYSYKIDQDDKIYFVSDNWQTFLSENNGAEHSSSSNIIGQNFWDFIAGWETKHLYQNVIKSVRKNRKEIKLPFRCDAPDLKRYLELTIRNVGLNTDDIEFLSEIKNVQPSETVYLLIQENQNSKALISMCSMCKNIKINDNEWQDTEQAIRTLGLFDGVVPKISHGICLPCFNLAMMEVNALENNGNDA